MLHGPPHAAHRACSTWCPTPLDACLFDETPRQALAGDACAPRAEPGRADPRSRSVDNGTGMSDEVREKLFTSFYSTKGHRGTGLGLLVTHKLVEEHGGRIEVRSALGQGTTVQRCGCPSGPRMRPSVTCFGSAVQDRRTR
ncbi:MAG: sensor histidine kinase [Desulfobacterales bacterium]|nr:sensor histidine kinase [Desulfobacterales bacterium]